MGVLRRNLASGLIVVAPVAIVLLVIQYVFRWIADLPLVAGVEPPWLRVVTALVVFFALVTAVGYLMRTALGVLLADLITAGINRIPGLRVVYNAAHLAIETALRSSTGEIEPVKVETWQGLRVNAFDTGNRTEDGRVLCFFPTSPNITTGYVIEVEEENLTRTGEGIEAVLMRVLSAGYGGHPDADATTVPVEGARVVDRVSGIRIDEDG